MRAASIAVSAAALFVASQTGGAAGGQFDAPVYDGIKPSILQVECPGLHTAATGFVWQNSGTAVTALHVVAGCPSVIVHYEAQKVQSSAKVVKVLRHADLALLKIQEPADAQPLAVESRAIPLSESLSTLGYPLQIPKMEATELHLRYGGKTLGEIIPQSIAEELEAAGSPSLKLEIADIDGHLLPGHSGAPVFDRQRKLVAIADGGLQNGAVAVSWAIPAKFLDELAASHESSDGGQGARPRALFAAETEAKNRGEVSCSGQNLIRLRSVGFNDAAKSADDPKGLYQLLQFFQVDPTQFRFDVYQHAASGATFVLPEGSTVEKTSNGDCASSLSSGRVQLHLQLAVMGSQAEAQNTSLRFEQMLAGSNPQQWVADPQWTYLMPMPRFDGMMVRRRAWSHWQTFPVAFQDRYAFESLAVRKNVFIGAAAMYSWTPQLAQRARVCRVTPIPGQCDDVRAFLFEWVKSVLAIQLTTFPIG